MSRNVKAIILDLFEDRDTVRNHEVATRLGVTRQAAHHHLRRLVEEGELERIGAGRGTRYRRVAPEETRRFVYETEGLEEDLVWTELVSELECVGGLGESARETLQYAVTELVNNAIDHSGAPEVALEIEHLSGAVRVAIIDRGLGLFAHVQRALGLESELEALQELSKGKLTTAPERHTGEGLFFVSKAVDIFEAESGGLRWLVDNERGDVLVEDLERHHAGTTVTVSIASGCERDIGKVFERYTKNYEFVVTRTVIKLFTIGVRFVSRSEAKRLVRGLERFREVVLDFKGVRGIGQGFADEVFRVWANRHPEVTLLPVNMSRAVEFMVVRARGVPERG